MPCGSCPASGSTRRGVPIGTGRAWRPPAVLVIVAVVALAMATTWWAMWLLWPGLAWAGGGCGSGRYRESTPARDRADDVIHV